MALKVWGAGSTQGSDGLWDTATNWDNDTAPVDGDSLLFDNTALYAMTNGPSSGSVIIENIQVTSDSLVPSINGTYPLVIIGQLNSLSASQIYISIYPYGITSIVGPWIGNVIYPSDKPVNNTGIAYLGISQVLFDPSNYLELVSSGGGIGELKYGTSDIFLNVYGEDSFTSFTIDTVNGNLNGFPLTGVSKITSQVIEFDSTFLSLSNTGMQLNAPVVNITQIGSLINYAGGGLFGLPNLTFNQPCTLNISSPSGGPYQPPINKDLKFIFMAGGTINLYGQATIYGTNSLMGAMGSNMSEVLLYGYGGAGLTINAYNNSLVGGLYVGGSFTDATLSQFGGSPCGITMRDNSVFQGLLSLEMGSGISFLDSSNVSFSYGFNNFGSGFQFTASPSSIAVGGGDIPQSAGGLTIFKASF